MRFSSNEFHGGTHVEPHVGNDCYRKLRVTRVILHRNLVTAIIIRNIFSIVVKTVITLDALTDNADSVRKLLFVKSNQLLTVTG